MITVKRALLSCADKTGLDAFAKTLKALGVELVASGGTAEFLVTQGVRSTTVEQFAGITEQLDGRVKTLHPKIHAGILARRDDPAHVAAVGAGGLIDLVVVNLYPFEETIATPGVTVEAAVEQIDIGGVALLRAAAKNFQHVAVVCQPQQYAQVAEALTSSQGRLDERLSRELAARAFTLASAYDQRIAGFLGSADGSQPSSASPADLPDSMSVTIARRQRLRYGENPHQRGAWYVPASTPAYGVGTLTQRQGKTLSYNNLLDLDAAVRCLLEFPEPTCAIVKHSSLCGLASAADGRSAYERAFACDAESAFGGIVGVNRPIDRALADALMETFLEVVAAPAASPEAEARFARKPNLRLIILEWPRSRPAGWEWRQVLGGWLLQEPDAAPEAAEALRVITTRAPTDAQRAQLLFAWRAAKHVRSNAVVLARESATVGIGQGQPSRVGSVRLALEKAGARSRGAVAASDGFFPFPDSVELLAKAGVAAIIQPGGSIRDEEVIAAANAAGLAMALTGVRHFRH